MMKPAIKKLFIFISFLFVIGLFAFALTPLIEAGYGEAGVAPTCTAEKPETPWLYYTEYLGDGKVKLVWDKNNRASSWTVAYGQESGKYIWGLNNFGYGEMRSVTINELPDGTYYFVVRANNGCMPGPFSNEQMVRVGRGGTRQVAAKAPVALGQPQATPTPGVKYTPPQKGVTGTPKLTQTPVKPMPTSVPEPAAKLGFFQRIINFFLNLFK